MEDKTILFQPMGKRIRADAPLTLLEAAYLAGAGIAAVCGGMGRCGRCRVEVRGNAPPPEKAELEILGSDGAGGFRLACQTRVSGPATVWVPEASRLHRQVILTGGTYTTDFDPEINIFEIEVPPPAFEDPAADHKRLLKRLSRIPETPEGTCWRTPVSVLRGLTKALRSCAGKVSVVATRSGRILDVSPGWDLPCMGLAVDLGTTTVVAYLMDLRSGKPIGVKADMNPQVAEAEDVISRISLCLRDPDNLKRLSGMVQKCIHDLAAAVCRKNGTPTDRIFEYILVGNTVMHHLLLGLDPANLAVAPYRPVVVEDISLRAAELGLPSSPEAGMYLAPLKAGFVGADAVAMALALEADQVNEPTLMVDLGTNGEIVLATPDAILCCATAAGPAFEGGHIRWGMRGAPGAVDGFELPHPDGEPILSVIGGCAPIGICGSGLVSIVSALFRAGVVTPAGAFAPERAGSRLREGPDGMQYLLAGAEKTGTGQDMVLTHHDLAQLQLAKAAVHAGISLMMAELGVIRLSRVMLAGAFGNYLTPEAACGIRMLPGVTPDRIASVGNAAGAGAVMMLTDRARRRRAKHLADRMRYLELAVHPGFKEAFLAGMAFSD